jgi:toxin ParE1/3/4
MLAIRYNTGASKELVTSALYYSKQALGLGERFLIEVENSVREIATSPQRFPQYHKNVRRCVMSQFPYGIYFREDGDKIRILAIAHTSRHPAYWKLRK